ncbi:serine/threonine protein kinase [Nocardiopsis aegyptia]|uniref:serine/threonine protein kinase n=1 Tax=Nocardiopsis aegyptia TaxID=220378 RepID=UPI00366BC71C
MDGTARTVGEYRLVRSLGRGGFGEVFLGETGDGARAAVKLLHASWAGDADMRRRFAAEVEQARRVSGFCIAGILDADPEAEQPWIATEYIDGPTLQASVVEEGPRSGDELQRLAVSTATALAAIHAAGVVHRDLKPDNIMLAADGPRVIDFGIARAVESTSVTASGVVGTIGYMAPEQLEGLRLTSAVDLFSWGSVMVFAATGHEAFPGPTQASRVARVLSGEPETADVPVSLAAAVRACLDKDPRQRPDAPTLLDHLVTGRPLHTGGGPAVADTRATRVEGAPAIPATRTYTRLETAPPPVEQAVESPASDTDSGTRAPLTQGAYAGAGSGSAPPGEAPPYHFAGIRFTRVGALAAAMQEHWPAAVAVFGDAAELAALGSWIVDDVGDTTIDRALFRRQVRDVNLAVASFVAQARPDLPPVFRGHDASVPGLRKLFHDPRPLLTGAPMANELVLLARPAVLRVMASHGTGDAAELRSLAGRLDAAERAGTAFHQELVQNLVGWRDVPARVDPALILTFLLDPALVVAPEPGIPRAAGDWIAVLWSRVEGAAGAERAGYAATVYGVLPTVTRLARQRAEWERGRQRSRLEHQALLKSESQHGTLRTVVNLSGCASLPFLVVFPGALVTAASSGEDGFTVFAVLCLVMAGGLIAMAAYLHFHDVSEHGDKGTVTQRRILRQNLPRAIEGYDSGVHDIDADLERARRLCAQGQRRG